ncbi:MAG: hypothetical protein C4519_10620 [Desulfobacteraceae bacterium]|nr:MAG: hypothetical protein C4519_10620 [Desulfobacteraceae bacterium]
MGMFNDVLRRMASFLSDADPKDEPKTKPGIQELAAKRLQALQGRMEMVEAQVRLAAQTRRDLQKLVAEAKAVEGLGKQAMIAGNTQKSAAAMARYAIMQQSIQHMTAQAKTADEQATAALESFRTEAQAAQRAASEAKALAQLESVIELQKKHQALALTQSTAADEFEAAREELLLSASVQAAALSLQSGREGLDAEIAAAQKNAEVAAIGRRWQREIAESGAAEIQEAEYTDRGDDPAESAIKFLEKPPLGGLIDLVPPKKQ